MRGRALVGLAAACTLLAGCGDGGASPDRTAAPPLKGEALEKAKSEWEKSVRWRTLGDGSRFYSGFNGPTRRIARCWGAAPPFDCLLVTETDTVTGTHVALSRRTRARLSPRLTLPEEEGGGGYSCTIVVGDAADGFYEKIETGAGSERQNAVLSGRAGTPWKKEEALAMLSARAPAAPQEYFSCASLNAVIRRGGLAVLEAPGGGRLALLGP